MVLALPRKQQAALSLTPVVRMYARVTIQEDAEASRLGYLEGSFRPRDRASGLTRLTYTIELDPVVGVKREQVGKASNPMVVDALNGLSWRYMTEQGVQRSGAILDSRVVAEWMRNAPLAPPISEEHIGFQSSELTDVLRAAAKENADRPFWPSFPSGKTPSRLNLAAHVVLNHDFMPGMSRPGAFLPFVAADNVKWESTVPIVYVGVPLALAIWGAGLWLLSRRRPST